MTTQYTVMTDTCTLHHFGTDFEAATFAAARIGADSSAMLRDLQERGQTKARIGDRAVSIFLDASQQET